MLCEKERSGRTNQKTLYSKRQTIIVKVRQQHLQKIFKTLRATNFQPRQQQIIPPQMILPSQPLVPNYSVANIQMIQQYMMRFIPPQIQMNQRMVFAPRGDQIQQDIPKQKSSPMEYQIYFQKGNFRVFKRLLGEGSFSRVWLGVDLVRNQRIAAKQVKKLEYSQQRCLKQFDNPNIIKVLEIMRHGESTFIILQFCSKNLRQELQDCDYNVAKSLDYFQQIVKGMNQLQKNNIIHRDLKFENILLNQNVIKIADFGLAKFMGDQIEIQSRRCGSPYTMAPQIYFSQTLYPSYTSKCDIWSLGVILHEMLYKQHPFGKNKQNFKKGLRIQIKKSFGALDKLITRCLVEDPKKRADWAQFLHIYQNFIQNKQRYLSIPALPIQCESIIYEERHAENDDLRVNSQNQKDGQVEVIVQILEKKNKKKESNFKRIYDFDAYESMQNKREQNLRLKRIKYVWHNEKFQRNTSKIKQNLQEQENKLPFEQIKKQNLAAVKMEDNVVNPPIQLEQNKNIQEQHQGKGNQQNAPQSPKKAQMKKLKTKKEGKMGRICGEMSGIGLFLAILLIFFLFK